MDITIPQKFFPSKITSYTVDAARNGKYFRILFMCVSAVPHVAIYVAGYHLT